MSNFLPIQKRFVFSFFVHLSCCICVYSLWYLFCRCCRYCRCYRCCIIRHQKIQKSTWTYQRQRFVRWHRQSDRFVILKLEIVRFFFFSVGVISWFSSFRLITHLILSHLKYAYQNRIVSEFTRILFFRLYFLIRILYAEFHYYLTSIYLLAKNNIVFYIFHAITNTCMNRKQKKIIIPETRTTRVSALNM